MDSSYDTAIEELKDATDPIEKQMLLQKYGLIEPKLMPYEKEWIVLEAEGVVL